MLKLRLTLISTHGTGKLFEMVPGTFGSPMDVWDWECRSNQTVSYYGFLEAQCVRVLRDTKENAISTGLSLSTCKATCGKYRMLWPKPTSASIEISKSLFEFYSDRVRLLEIVAPSTSASELAHKAVKTFFGYFSLMHSNRRQKQSDTKVNLTTDGMLHLKLFIQAPYSKIDLETDESYELSASMIDPMGCYVLIRSPTVFGARHALETLSQLISFDERSRLFQIPDEFRILDKPAYRHRGILVDSSRNFLSIETIKSIIRGMSYNKLNTLHWHLTDTQSFPFDSQRVPQMARYGAYSPEKTYSAQDLTSIGEYANERGVRIIPELDGPAHVGSGWEWGPLEGKGDLAVCVDRKPWSLYCLQPPCGQINPVNPNSYAVLNNLFQDLVDIFQPDAFHVGGDEVNFNCWNTTASITDWLIKNGHSLDDQSYFMLWTTYLSEASKVITQTNSTKPITKIFWTSRLTNESQLAEEFFNAQDSVIQVWDKSNDYQVPNFLQRGYKLILSHYDRWYLDCGFEAWIGEGNNWCAPLKGWKVVYDFTPRVYLNESEISREKFDELILGGEAGLWSEQVDDQNIHMKLWPRAAALAERLWSDPNHGWEAAKFRMNEQRQRMVQRGIMADALEPEWCRQNEGFC